MTNGTVRAKIIIRGAVQGVGFRPFVFRLAKELDLSGWVNNDSTGVFIEIESAKPTIEKFLARLHAEKPPLSSIYSTETTYLDPVGYTDFSIRESGKNGSPTTLILPDIAVCDECLKEMNDPANRRYRYPFINCTHCGPRYSIIESLPYDRPNTTMKKFLMCPECEKEYHDPANRRFHAQPIACPKCGPHTELWDTSGLMLSSHYESILRTAGALREGKIVALKGLGGFQLLCIATNDAVVSELRRRKHRDEKSFAVMFPSLGMVEKHCSVSNTEKRLLLSPESPIVLLKRKLHTSHHEPQIVTSVAPHNPYLGVMLPYTPLHHLLMQEVVTPVVATSGNISDEPMCIDEMDALKKLNGIADLFLVHNRPIRRCVDDSVVRVVMDREMIIRRARGYAPLPLILKDSSEEPVLAVGGHLKNTIALKKKNMIFVSQHIGDLETVPSLESFKQTINDLSSMYDHRPEIVIHDMHPNYISTAAAKEWVAEKIPVQHHIAHIASCMAENELNEPLLGVAWDGTGYGLDGTIWGGEFIVYDGDNFSRFATIRSFQLPGGDSAVKESLRSAVGVLYEMYGAGLFHHPVLRGKYSAKEARLILQMMKKKINAPRTTSIGRLFDAVGAILGIRDRSSFEGQTAMEVEFAAREIEEDEYFPLTLLQTDDPQLTIDWEPMFNCLLSERAYCDTATLARKFHNTMVEMIVAVAQRAHYKKIVLSGGCFQNALLLERTVHHLREEGFKPYWHQRVPTNDGGISLGQAFVHRLVSSKIKKGK
ncbi:MAG: carbamoyltransferase HypF [Bacteroidota bacterium]